MPSDPRGERLQIMLTKMSLLRWTVGDLISICRAALRRCASYYGVD